jgi:putative ABC transport system substrate-binding protein
MADPIRTGLVSSLSRPGGNLTGMSMGYAEGLTGKWLELLQEIVPRLTAVAVLTNPDNPVHLYLLQDIQAAALRRQLKVHPVEVREAQGLATAFAIARKNAQGMILIADAVTLEHPNEVVSLANINKFPVVYNMRSFVLRGGLVAYASELEAQYRRAAELVDKIARGTRPADLPIEQPNKYELLVNLRTAKALGLVIPKSVLVRADKVIE